MRIITFYNEKINPIVVDYQKKVFNHNKNQEHSTLVSTASSSITSLYYKNKFKIIPK